MVVTLRLVVSFPVDEDVAYGISPGIEEDPDLLRNGLLSRLQQAPETVKVESHEVTWP